MAVLVVQYRAFPRTRFSCFFSGQWQCSRLTLVVIVSLVDKARWARVEMGCRRYVCRGLETRCEDAPFQPCLVYCFPSHHLTYVFFKGVERRNSVFKLLFAGICYAM